VGVRLSRYSTRATALTVATGEPLAEQRAAVAVGCISHQSSDMLYKPELAQDANSGKAAIIALTVMLPTFPGQFTSISNNFPPEGACTIGGEIRIRVRC